MKPVLFGLAFLLACAPLAGCNQQRGNKHQTAQEQGGQGEKGRRAERRERAEDSEQGEVGERGRRGGRGHGLRRVCADELQKYCAGDERGRERRECLQTHLDQLSADCKAAVEARGERRHRRD